MAAILGGTAHSDIEGALLQSYLDGVASVYIPMGPSNVDERIAEGIEAKGIEPRVSVDTAVADVNAYLVEAGHTTQTNHFDAESLLNYVANPTNADSVVTLSEAIGYELVGDVTYDTASVGGHSAIDKTDTNGNFDGYTITYTTTAGEVVVTRFTTTAIDLSEFHKGFSEGFERGFEAGYNAGYNDGYNDGYADGYSDGFKDGVASVS